MRPKIVILVLPKESNKLSEGHPEPSAVSVASFSLFPTLYSAMPVLVGTLIPRLWQTRAALFGELACVPFPCSLFHIPPLPSAYLLYCEISFHILFFQILLSNSSSSLRLYRLLADFSASAFNSPYFAVIWGETESPTVRWERLGTSRLGASYHVVLSLTSFGGPQLIWE